MNELIIFENLKQYKEECLSNFEKEFAEVEQTLRRLMDKGAQIRQSLSDSSISTPKAPKAPKAQKSHSDSAPKKRGRSGGFENKISLKEAITQVLSRNSKGLASTEIAQVIKDEKIWETNGNLGTQISTNLFALKKEGVVEKDGKIYKLA